ncbi:MAG: hypothetical protein M3389_14215 [Actinomycetota bacterium]|nr:hypothetical protein [Actinomycetota bacterium]
MDVNSTGRVIHALAALRDADGDVATAAASKGIPPEILIRALAEGGANFYEQTPDGRVRPTAMGLRFAEQEAAFPYVNW